MSKLKFKLLDFYGLICYDGNDYNKALSKAKLLPSMYAICAYDETGKELGVLWTAKGVNLPKIKIETLMPN